MHAPLPSSPARRTSSRRGLLVFVIVAAFVVVSGVVAFRFYLTTWKEFGAKPPAEMPREEVVALLAGPKRDFVGEWKSATSTLVIDASSRVSYSARLGAFEENVNGGISYFADDAFYVGGVRFAIAEAPHRDGILWKMRARDTLFVR